MKIRREELRSIAKSRERERVKKSEKEKAFHFFLSFPFSVHISPYLSKSEHTKRSTARGTRKRERGLGKWNTANGPMTPWHTFHGSSQRKWKGSTDLRSSDLRHTYLTNCISTKYVSSSLNEDRKNIDIYTYRNIRLLRDENYIRSRSIYLLDGVYEPTVQIVSIN